MSHSILSSILYTFITTLPRDFELIAFTNRNIHSVVTICFTALLVLEVLVQSPLIYGTSPPPS